MGILSIFLIHCYEHFDNFIVSTDVPAHRVLCSLLHEGPPEGGGGTSGGLEGDG
jgi:hypothetical protein